MAVNIQARGAKFQLRIKHKQLPKPFFFTFDDEAAARSYGNQLQALLDAGIVPTELLAKPAPPDNPLLVEIVRAYVLNAPQVTTSDDALLGSMLAELVAVRLADVTNSWTERYVRDLKVRDNLAPGTIRKRVGALARVIDWHLRRTESAAANPLRMLPHGYSQYTGADVAALPKTAKPKVDVKRDFRLGLGDEPRALACMDAELALLYRVIVNTGARLREAYTLRTDQLNLERGWARLEGTKGPRGLLKPRVVPLMPALRDELRIYCRDRVGRLFSYWDGDPKTLDAVTAHLSYRFVKAFRDAGIPDLTEHDLRHEATCRWLEHRTGAGWTFSEMEVCRIMGWSNLQMIVRYASLRAADLSARLEPAAPDPPVASSAHVLPEPKSAPPAVLPFMAGSPASGGPSVSSP